MYVLQNWTLHASCLCFRNTVTARTSFLLCGQSVHNKRKHRDWRLGKGTYDYLHRPWTPDFCWIFDPFLLRKDKADVLSLSSVIHANLCLNVSTQSERDTHILHSHTTERTHTYVWIYECASIPKITFLNWPFCTACLDWYSSVFHACQRCGKR